ncbi:unnamed protein product [Protopolystoma xenopodis]|uniref:Uncharacterized protein n=1 Tax=Protopolystoma xenopodis TaxID=117903 RepID=A0A448XT28_9PLAT|nr:unnamed protein product [Protopolystoma xenopodis]
MPDESVCPIVSLRVCWTDWLGLRVADTTIWSVSGAGCDVEPVVVEARQSGRSASQPDGRVDVEIDKQLVR